MSDLSVSLTPEELAIIEARRAEEKARQEEADRKAREQYESVKKGQLERAEYYIQMADTLAAADEDGILLIEKSEKLYEHDLGNYKVPTVKIIFFLNGREEEVRIEEHITGYRYGRHFSRSSVKYHLCGGFNDYARRYYKRAATVITRIKEFQDIAEARRKRDRRDADLTKRAIRDLVRTYPDAEVKHEKGYEFGSGRHYQSKPDRIVVSTDKGSYTFRYYENDGEIKYSVYSRNIKPEVDAEIQKLVLGA